MPEHTGASVQRAKEPHFASYRSVVSYAEGMSEAEKAESSRPVEGDEDAETLAAIQRGRDDANAGRTQPLEEVRKRLPQWISESSSPKKQ